MSFFKSKKKAEKPEKPEKSAKKKKKEPVKKMDPAMEAAIKTALVPIKLFEQVNLIIFIFNLVLIVCLVALAIERASLYPLIEKRYSFLEVVGESENYVNVRYTNKFKDEGLIKELVYRYVTKREAINPKNDVKYIINYSAPQVQEEYMEIQKALKDRAVRGYRTRTVMIDRYQKIESNIRQVEIITKDFIINPDLKNDQTPTVDERRWLINVEYEFEEKKRAMDEIRMNPYGFFVVKYNLVKG